MFGVTRDQVAAVRPFEGLDDETLDAVIAHSLFVWSPAGQTVVKTGDAGHGFYIILSGDADVRIDGDTVARLGPGDLFGEMALEGRGKRSADVVARAPLSLMTMSVWNYQAISAKYPVVAERLRDLAEQRRADTPTPSGT